MNVTVNMRQLSILVVDDDPFTLNLAVSILGQLGYTTVDTANNGNTALGKLVTQSTPFDIIICDLNMPEMDGIEFLRHTSNSAFDGGIILLSGEDKRILETALGLVKTQNLKILGALTKPLNTDALAQLLNNFQPSSSEVRHYSPERPITEEELRNGIKGSSDNQLHLVYQPKINVKTGQITGVETLARWWNINRGVLGPETFIPLAEATGLIDVLTNDIYRKAIIQSSEWAGQGLKLRTAVNFSINSFSNPAFCNFLGSLEVAYGVHPNQIILEVTETQAMTIASDCLEALMRMRIKRFGLSIDDFGTGNSSLAQLKNIPFSEMKIDRAFVHGAADDDSALAILETSIDLARRLDMEIVAEGAETRADWDLVESLGCDYVQGFYCAKPMRSEDLVEFVTSWTGPH